MLQVTLIYPTPEGSREIRIDGERTTFGRGSDAQHRFPDDGLSRLHATLYRDGDRVWIVDENSANGTFVNGQRVSGAGVPLNNGDSIRIGHRTNLSVRMAEAVQTHSMPPAPVTAAVDSPEATSTTGLSLLPVVLIAVALFVVTLSAVFIGYTVLGGDREVAVADTNRDSLDDTDLDDTDPTPKPADPPKGDATHEARTPAPDATPAAGGPTGPQVNDILKGRKYYDLSDAEKAQYLSEKAMKIARLIGNNSTAEIPPLALEKIKSFTDGYASRRNSKGRDGCTTMRPWGDNLQETYGRASRNAPFINKAFQEKDVDPRVGLYLAMVESEHCPCLQSGTGPLGLFQFAYATAQEHFVPNTGLVKGARPPKGDVRCEQEAAARGAASFMKMLITMLGADPASVPLAIGSYNSGQNGLIRNLEKALGLNSGLNRDFWTLIANSDKLSKQFQMENFKYVPKFFAAAIIGENPKDFGLDLQPLSTY